MIVFEKFGQHQPLNRQAERYALEGAPIALSTMADAVGSVCAALAPILRLAEAHVMAAERLHGDDTTELQNGHEVPGKIGRLSNAVTVLSLMATTHFATAGKLGDIVSRRCNPTMERPLPYGLASP